MDKLQSVEKYGERYVRDFLGNYIPNKDEYLKDWYKALDFFFGKSFMRGRKDKLSERFWLATMKTLETDRPSKGYDRQTLENRLVTNGVNNGRDRRMVLEVIDFIFNSLDDFENNIVKYAVSGIKSGKISEVFNRLDGIFEIGDKIACFYLRDIIMVYQLESYLKAEDFRYCQPVDTWVIQTASKLGIVRDTKIPKEEARETIIGACLKANVSPLLFNAGAWIVGARSFDLLLEKI